MTKISLEELLKQNKELTYQENYQKIMKLVETEKIKPLKASGKNGKKPALYLEYWITEPKINDLNWIEELKYKIVSTISVDYYLTHLKNYEQDRKFVLLMNDYLKNHKEQLNYMESMNERSFEIWKREKFLKQERGKKVLKRMGISMEFLNLYETTEPLSYYSHSRQVPQNLLIIENKDTFYTMRRHLLEGGDKILGIEISTLIYGAGKGILRSFRDFSLCMEPYMNHEDNRIYYFGDLDYEGIGIYENLYGMFRENCEILPFSQAYLAMIRKIEDILSLPDTKEGQNRHMETVFLNYFEEEEQNAILDILSKGKYIPQEILTIQDLSYAMEKTENGI
ncbi:MAG: DUF2220 family protein [Lachnospiraceae bacterium]